MYINIKQISIHIEYSLSKQEKYLHNVMKTLLPSNSRLRQILKSELRIFFEFFPLSSLIGQFKIFEKCSLKIFELTNQRRGRENSKYKNGPTLDLIWSRLGLDI